MNCLMTSATETMTMRSFITALLLAVLFSGTAPSQSFLPDKPRGMVNDYAGMLTAGEANRLEMKLRSYRDTTTNVIAIATLESLQGYSRDEIATTLFNKWRMWEGERFNGVLILISKHDRELKIEVGYGLEGAIPDAMANRIVQDVLIPNLRDGTVFNGLDRATDIMIELAAGEFEGAPEFKNQAPEIPIDLIIFFAIVLFIVIRSIRKGGGGRGGGGRRRTIGAADVIFWNSMLGGGSGPVGIQLSEYHAVTYQHQVREAFTVTCHGGAPLAPLIHGGPEVRAAPAQQGSQVQHLRLEG